MTIYGPSHRLTVGVEARRYRAWPAGMPPKVELARCSGCLQQFPADTLQRPHPAALPLCGTCYYAQFVLTRRCRRCKTTKPVGDFLLLSGGNRSKTCAACWGRE